MLEPIHIAAKNGHMHIVNYILAKSKNLKATCSLQVSSSFSTPLHLAAYGGHYEICESLLNSGAHFLNNNKYGDTFLHIAIRHDHTEFLKNILTYFGNNIENMLQGNESQQSHVLDVENNQEHCTPYTLAVLRENFDVADMMFENEWSNCFFKNQNNETVFDIVNRIKIKNVQKYLVDQADKMQQMKKRGGGKGQMGGGGTKAKNTAAPN